MWLCLKKGARGAITGDYPHRAARDLEEATRGAGLCSIKVEADIILNLSVGPWLESARFHQLCGGRAGVLPLRLPPHAALRAPL